MGDLRATASISPRSSRDGRKLSSSQFKTLSVLSSVSKQPRAVFCTATRFPPFRDRNFDSPRNAKAASSPALLKGADVTLLPGGLHNVIIDDEMETEVPMISTDTLKEFSSMNETMPSTSTFSKLAPRMDGSTDRFLDTRYRPALPNPNFYTPAESLGIAAVPAFTTAPKFTFHGGRSRTEEFEPEYRRRKAVSEMGSASVPAQKPAPGEQTKTRALRSRRIMCRGFGSEARLKQQKITEIPGPGCYEVFRIMDPVPDWVPSSTVPWGVRSDRRPDLVNHVETLAGPGEHCAGAPFSGVSAPTTIIGHPIKKLRDSRASFPAPNRYNLATTIGTGLKAPICDGPKSSTVFKPKPGPGPAAYGGDFGPKDDLLVPSPASATFGHSERQHIAETVDPDEPPGPGTHKVRRDWTVPERPGGSLSRAEKCKGFHGMGPAGNPAPGHYKSSSPRGLEMTVHVPVNRPREDIPGPCDYDPSIEFISSKAPAYGPLGRTAPRRTIFDLSGSGREANSQELVKRALAAVAEIRKEQGLSEANTGFRDFVSEGPKIAFTSRRPCKELEATKEAALGPDFLAGYSSFG